MLAVLFLSLAAFLLAPSRLASQSPAQGGFALEERSSDISVPTPDPLVRYGLVSGGFISRTTDGGATWNAQQVSANARLVAPSPNVCWVVGSSGRIYRTTDGTTRKKIHPPAPVDFTAVPAKDASSAPLTSADGRKFSTSNHGTSWQPVQ